MPCLGLHVKFPICLSCCNQIFISRTDFNESAILNFPTILPVEAALIRADRRTDGHDEANRRFSQVCEHS